MKPRIILKGGTAACFFDEGISSRARWADSLGEARGTNQKRLHHQDTKSTKVHQAKAAQNP
jgi:hypothetical protein